MNAAFIINSACGATLVRGRPSPGVVASPKSKVDSITGTEPRRTGRYSVRRLESSGVAFACAPPRVESRLPSKASRLSRICSTDMRSRLKREQSRLAGSASLAAGDASPLI